LGNGLTYVLKCKEGDRGQKKLREEGGQSYSKGREKKRNFANSWVKHLSKYALEWQKKRKKRETGSGVGRRPREERGQFEVLPLRKRDQKRSTDLAKKRILRESLVNEMSRREKDERPKVWWILRHESQAKRERLTYHLSISFSSTGCWATYGGRKTKTKGERRDPGR